MSAKQKLKSKRPVTQGSAVTPARDSSAAAVEVPTEIRVGSEFAMQASAEAAAPVFVWMLLVLLFALHLSFAVRHSFPIPYWDESGYIPYVVGAKPVTLGWLWSQANEHRIPVPRLFYLFVARASGLDARLMNAVAIFLLAITACLGVIRLRRLQGKTTYAHAFIPLLLLSPAHYWNTVWPNQIAFVLPACLTCYAILLIAAAGKRQGMGRYLPLGPVALLTATCGASGLPFADALSPLLFWIGIRDFRAGARRRALVPLLCASAIWLYTAFYFVGLERVTPKMRPWNLGEALLESAKAISMSLGPSADVLWPYAAVVIVVLSLICAILSISAITKNGADPIPAWGLLLSLIGTVGVAVGIGFGRTTLGPGAAFASRYATIVAPILLTVFVVFTRFASVTVQRFVQMSLFTAACFVFSLNGAQATSEINELLVDGTTLEREVAQRVTIAQLAEEHGARWMFRPDIFASNMSLLFNARTGIYSNYPRGNIDGDLLWSMSAGTEVKGPLSSGRLCRLEDFALPKGVGLIAHAPHRTSVIVDRPARFVHVGIGILPGNLTAGVDFQVSVRLPDGSSRILWSRILDPVGTASDAGIKEADIALGESAKPGSRIVFDTAERPGKSNVGCWSFWTAVSLR